MASTYGIPLLINNMDAVRHPVVDQPHGRRQAIGGDLGEEADNICGVDLVVTQNDIAVVPPTCLIVPAFVAS